MKSVCSRMRREKHTTCVLIWPLHTLFVSIFFVRCVIQNLCCFMMFSLKKMLVIGHRWLLPSLERTVFCLPAFFLPHQYSLLWNLQILARSVVVFFITRLPYNIEFSSILQVPKRLAICVSFMLILSYEV